MGDMSLKRLDPQAVHMYKHELRSPALQVHSELARERAILRDPDNSMSRLAKGDALARIGDVTLGAFAFVPSSKVLDHLIRFLSTWSGTDKLFTLIEFTMKLVAPVLLARAKFRHRLGLRKEPTSSVATSFTKFSGIITDFRLLGGFFGILPILQWMISMERNPPPTRALLTIERLQGWSMLACCPLQQLNYLRAHDIIPATIPAILPLLGRTSKQLHLNSNSLVLWSCRAWAVYIVLQFAHLMEDRKLLLMKERNLRKGKGYVADDKQELRSKWDSFWNEVVVNSTNLPLALHWSLEQGLLPNDISLTVIGFINAVASFRSGWRATALSSPQVGRTSDATGSDLTITSEKEVTDS